MRAVNIIEKKRDGIALSQDEINFFIQEYTRGTIPDYQASAWAMAVLLNGMTPEETTFLTLAMAASGDTLDLGDSVDIVIDKHSSGGVGDKTSIVVVPLVRACGLPVGKMSGRGLGFSGGTLDKLESIHGFRTDLSKDEFLAQLKSIGMVLSGQSLDLAPADGKLYALRDVTGTVPSIPLIASSIMSKKIAAGAQGIVLDVKTGNGAFMKTLSQAKELASLMVSIGKLSVREVVAVLSDMNQPLGLAVGNALEIEEAIRTLQGSGPKDLVEHCIEISSHMLVLGKRAGSKTEAWQMAQDALESGRGLEQLHRLVGAQGGDVTVIDRPEDLPQAPVKEVMPALASGFIHQVHARTIGETAVVLGAGRSKKGEAIDPAVGLMILVKVGDRVEAGQPLIEIHARNEASLLEAKQMLNTAIKIDAEEIQPLPLFYGQISSLD